MNDAAIHSYRIPSRQFALAFVALALISGITIGMNKILVTLLALHINAESWQIGLMFGAESLSMMLMSLPAGIYISRFGARTVYLLASCAAAVLYPMISHAATWYVAAVLLSIAGVCIPFRVASMNTSWLERLPEIGKHRSGWYRGTLMLGIGLLGPLLGKTASERWGMEGCYWITSAMFAYMAFHGYIVLSRTHRQEANNTHRQGLREMLAHLTDPVVGQACLYDGMGGLVRGFFGTFIIILAVRQFHWDAQQGIQIMVVEGAAYVAVLLLMGGLASKLGEARTYNLGHASLILGLLMLGLSGNIAGLYAGALLQAVGQGFNHLVNVSRLAHSGKNMGHVSGLFTMVGMGGGFAGATLGGLLSEGFALQNIFLLWIPVWLAVCPGFRGLLARYVFNPS
jgi:ACDE family multidrug resistance protein